MSTGFLDYYRILEVDVCAGQEEIRRSYRRLAKKYHPDLHPERPEWAQEQFKLLVTAYQELMDPACRVVYDQKYRVIYKWRYLEAQSRRFYKDPLDWKVRQVLQLLLEGEREDAVRAYEEILQDTEAPDPLARMNIRDYLDCKFLLGEAYAEMGDKTTAMLLYEEVFEEERDEPRARCYFEQVVERLKAIYMEQLSNARSKEEAYRLYDRAKQLGVNGRDSADIAKKMAQALAAIGACEEAVSFLRAALQFNPKLKGITRICRQLNFRPGEPA